MIHLDPLPFGRRMIPGSPQPRLSEEVKVLRVESRDFEVEAQKELGCPKGCWCVAVNQNCFSGIFVDVFLGEIILPQLYRNSE